MIYFTYDFIIIDVVIDMSSVIIKDKKVVSIILMFAAFIAVTVFGLNVIFIIIICGLVGFLSVMKKSGKEILDRRIAYRQFIYFPQYKGIFKYLNRL